MTTDAHARPSILIVDDEFGLAEMLRELLTDIGYDVRLAINGRLALAVLRERAADVVLTDVMMPVMNGPELARALRQDERFRNTRIVFMTSLASALRAESDLGDAVLEKPFTPERLIATLRGIGANGAQPRG